MKSLDKRGVILVLIGLFFIAREYLGISMGIDWSRAWPIILVIVGIYLILKK